MTHHYQQQEGYNEKNMRPFQLKTPSVLYLSFDNNPFDNSSSSKRLTDIASLSDIFTKSSISLLGSLRAPTIVSKMYTQEFTITGLPIKSLTCPAPS